MELIIIALIAVEVVIVRLFRWCLALILFIEREWIFCQALIRDGPELWHMLAGSNEGETKKTVHT